MWAHLDNWQQMKHCHNQQTQCNNFFHCVEERNYFILWNLKKLLMIRAIICSFRFQCTIGQKLSINYCLSVNVDKRYIYVCVFINCWWWNGQLLSMGNNSISIIQLSETCQRMFVFCDNFLSYLILMTNQLID